MKNSIMLVSLSICLLFRGPRRHWLLSIVVQVLYYRWMWVTSCMTWYPYIYWYCECKWSCNMYMRKLSISSQINSCLLVSPDRPTLPYCLAYVPSPKLVVDVNNRAHSSWFNSIGPQVRLLKAFQLVLISTYNRWSRGVLGEGARLVLSLLKIINLANQGSNIVPKPQKRGPRGNVDLFKISRYLGFPRYPISWILITVEGREVHETLGEEEVEKM